MECEDLKAFQTPVFSYHGKDSPKYVEMAVYSYHAFHYYEFPDAIVPIQNATGHHEVCAASKRCRRYSVDSDTSVISLTEIDTHETLDPCRHEDPETPITITTGSPVAPNDNSNDASLLVHVGSLLGLDDTADLNSLEPNDFNDLPNVSLELKPCLVKDDEKHELHVLQTSESQQYSRGGGLRRVKAFNSLQSILKQSNGLGNGIVSDDVNERETDEIGTEEKEDDNIDGLVDLRCILSDDVYENVQYEPSKVIQRSSGTCASIPISVTPAVEIVEKSGKGDSTPSSVISKGEPARQSLLSTLMERDQGDFRSAFEAFHNYCSFGGYKSEDLDDTDEERESAEDGESDGEGEEAESKNGDKCEAETDCSCTKVGACNCPRKPVPLQDQPTGNTKASFFVSSPESGGFSEDKQTPSGIDIVHNNKEREEPALRESRTVAPKSEAPYILDSELFPPGLTEQRYKSIFINNFYKQHPYLPRGCRKWIKIEEPRLSFKAFTLHVNKPVVSSETKREDAIKEGRGRRNRQWIYFDKKGRRGDSECNEKSSEDNGESDSEKIAENCSTPTCSRTDSKQRSPSYEEDDAGGTYVGSFPKGFGYGPEEPEADGATSPGEEKPRILLMGLRRSGKSSIQKVVFHKVSPNETLFLESTSKIVKDDISNSSFVQFQIWDIPGQVDFFDATFDSEYIFGGCGALIFVIDAQDDYMEALSRLQMAVTRAHKIKETIKFEVFIHKVDGLSDDNKIETQRDILQRATDELADAGMDNIRLSFHLTSIYDHSIFEAFSKVVQKLIPQLPILENLLDIFITNSGIEKAFLFDVVSKIYIATDTSPVDMQCYELCCDMIDVVLDMSCIYGVRDDGAFDMQSASYIKLNSSTILFLREVNRHLALLCILRDDCAEHRGMIEYNFKCFRDAIQEVFVLRNQKPSESNNRDNVDQVSNNDYSEYKRALNGRGSLSHVNGSLQGGGGGGGVNDWDG